MEFEKRLKEMKGRIGIYREDLTSGEHDLWLQGQEDDVFESASVIKLWIMSAAYQQAEEGRMQWDSSVILRAEHMVPGLGIPDYQQALLNGNLTEDMFPESGVLNYMQPGLCFTVKDLMRLMILISDNTATNMMIDLLGIDEIREHIRSLGHEKTVLARKLFDTRPEVLGQENMISLTETADFFRRMYRGQLVSPEASWEMLALLQNQQNTYKIPFYIRRRPIAHKTGEDLGIENDVGIVLGHRPFILCFAANEAEEPEAVRLCQDAARELAEGGNR